MYQYDKSIKSSVSDEPINTYLLRPLAGLIVRTFYNTNVTPNQITVASILSGIIAAFVYSTGNPIGSACAGLLITLKDILDSADGQLARVKEQYSRAGRFLDSIGDFIVDLAVFAAIGWMLSLKHGSSWYCVSAFVGLVGITFRVSYHVFYQASFLHLEDKYRTNRITEEIRNEDMGIDRKVLALQRVFQLIYGWQDRLVLRMDGWCMGINQNEDFRKEWYSDNGALRLSGFLGMATELFLLTVCSLFNRLEFYLYLNVVLMNGLLLCNLSYRRFFLRKRLANESPGSLR